MSLEFLAAFVVPRGRPRLAGSERTLEPGLTLRFGRSTVCHWWAIVDCVLCIPKSFVSPKFGTIDVGACAACGVVGITWGF